MKENLNLIKKNFKWLLLGLKAEASWMMDVLVSDIIFYCFYLHKSYGCCKFSRTPKMPSWISHSRFFMLSEEQIGWKSFQNLQCLCWRHCKFYFNSAMHMICLHIKFYYFYAMHKSCFSYAGRYQIFVFLFRKHVISVFWAPLKMPHWNSDAVVIFYILIYRALAKLNLHFHFFSFMRFVVKSQDFFRARKLPLHSLMQWATSSSLFHNQFRINIHRNSFIGLKAKDFLRKD